MSNGTDTGNPTVVDFRGTRPALKCPADAANDNYDGQPPLEKRTVTLRKVLDKSGVTIKVKVPVGEYVGVAVATKINEEGVLTSSIELVHSDQELNYKVFEEEGNTDVVAEWQNWGRKLRLPLFVRTGDGELMPYSQQVGGLLVGNSNVRRKTANEANRRPRFLNRRKPGLALVR